MPRLNGYHEKNLKKGKGLVGFFLKTKQNTPPLPGITFFEKPTAL
jgi:hypothetical protein